MRESLDEVDFQYEAVVSLLADYGGAIFSFLALLFFSRVLGIAELGVALVVVSAAEIGSRIPQGIGLAVEKRITEDNVSLMSEFVMIGVLLNVVFDIFVSVIGFLGIIWFSFPKTITIAAIFLIVSKQFFLLFIRAYEGVGYPAYSQIIRNISEIFEVIFRVIFVVIGLGSVGIVLGSAVSFLIGVLIVLIFLPIKIVIPSVDRVISVLRFASWASPNAVFNTAINRIPPIIISIFIGSSAAAVVEIAKRILTPGLMVSQAIARPLFVKISNNSSKGDNITEIINQAITYSGILIIPLGFGALAIGELIITTLFGSQYTGYGLVFGLVVFSGIPKAYVSSLDTILKGIDKPKELFTATVIRLVIIVSIITITAKFTTLTVTAIAIILSRIIELIILTWQSSKQLTINLQIPETVIQEFSSGILMFSIVYTLGLLIPKIPVVDMLILVTFGAIIYIVSLLFSDNTILKNIKEFI